MINLKTLVSFACILLISYDFDGLNSTTSDNVPVDQYKLVEAFPGLTFDMPVELTSPDDDTDRIFVIEQKGVIQLFRNDGKTDKATVFLDIERQVSSGGEMGLLGLAFHPEFKTSGYFYINYTRRNPLETVISRFKVNPSNPNVADPASELVLLRFDQPYDNHNGGKIAFGNDGFLYIATGDGGSWGDPKNRSQNRKELLGKILRIDVDKQIDKINYGIPSDNPFVGNKDGFREEIFAYGMRNPWRFNFDRKTGELWAGDVGQNKLEEIDVIEKGQNYGWKVMEANECYRTSQCDSDRFQPPIWSYIQGPETGQSVTGGYVCRDKNLPALEGKYIYGDFVTGNIWALTHANKKATKNERIAKITGGLPSFGEDNRKNLYILSYNPGKIYKLALNK